MEISNTTSNQVTLNSNENAEEQKKATENQQEIKNNPQKERLQNDIFVLSGGHNGDSPKNKEKQD